MGFVCVCEGWIVVDVCESRKCIIPIDLFVQMLSSPQRRPNIQDAQYLIVPFRTLARPMPYSNMSWYQDL
jgi:hypothetical protein